MKFHDYTTSYALAKRRGDIPSGFSVDRYYSHEIHAGKPEFAVMHLSVEKFWIDGRRPYYNVWPGICDLLLSVSLDVPGETVSIPEESMLIRLAEGHEVDGLQTALISRIPEDKRVVNDQIPWVMSGCVDGAVIVSGFAIRENETFEERAGKIDTGKTFSRKGISRETASTAVTNIMRLAVGISILASDPVFVQPVILNKHRDRYESASEEDKRDLEERAAKIQGKGFDVGRGQEEEIREVSAHIRRPHLCIFWTGKGRKTPRLQMRSGSVIHPKSVTDVPTGYLDDEEKECTND